MLTPKEKHNKLFDQFVYEMFCAPEQSPKPHKRLGSLSNRGLVRKKFCEKMKRQAKEDPGEIK